MSPLTLSEYAYNGLGRRIKKVVSNSGGLNGSYFYYYAPGSHQVIEVRSSVGGTVLSQQVWGFAYIDELCQTLINGDPTGDPDFNPSDPDHDPQAYYALQDANFNVTQVYDAAGGLVERYAYDPYGRRSVFTDVAQIDLPEVAHIVGHLPFSPGIMRLFARNGSKVPRGAAAGESARFRRRSGWGAAGPPDPAADCQATDEVEDHYNSSRRFARCGPDG